MKTLENQCSFGIVIWLIARVLASIVGVTVWAADVAAEADAEGPDLKVVGVVHLPNCWAHEAVVRDGYAFIACDEEEKGLTVVDVREPRDPKPVGYSGLFSGFAYYVALHGNYALVGGNTPHLCVYDVKNPGHVRLVSSVWLGRSGPIAVQGDYAFVSGGDALKIVNLSDPLRPQWVGSVSGDQFAAYHTRLRAFGNAHIVAPQGGRGLGIVNLGDPLRPVVTHFQYLENPSAVGVAVTGNLAVVLDTNVDGKGRPNVAGARLFVVDLSEMAQPRPRGSIPVGPGGPCNRQGIGVAARESFAYVANNSRLTVFDVSNPDKPVSRGSLDFGRTFLGSVGRFHLQGIAVDGDHAYMSDYYFGVFVADVSNPDAPKEIGRIPAAGEVRDVYAFGGRVAVADYNGGVFFIDATNPSKPRITKQFYCGGIMRSVTGDGKGLVFAAGESAMVFDATDIGDVKLLYHGQGAGTTAAVAYANGIVYYGGIQRLDLRDPSNPRPLPPVADIGTCWGLATDGRHLYATGQREVEEHTLPDSGKKSDGGQEEPKKLVMRPGLCVYDISNPAGNATAVAFIPAPLGRCFLTLQNGRLLVPYWQPGGCSDLESNRVEIYDVTDATKPVKISTIFRYEGLWGPHKVKADFENHLLYVAEYQDGVKVYGIQDMKHPRLLAHHIGGYRMNFSMDLDGDYLYRGRLGAIEILDIGSLKGKTRQ
ncbi:MAG: hypothetical protein HYU36_02250 [Planctomycetes bacterium]|nr:hypothetical protein [Planctomycetota bacterium]